MIASMLSFAVLYLNSGYASRNCATLAGHTVPLLSLRLPIATMPFLDEFAGRNCAN